MRSTALIALLVSLVATTIQAQTVTNGSMTGPPTVSSPPPGWTSATLDGDTVPPGGISFYAPGIPASPDGGTMLTILDNSGYIGSFTFDSVQQVIAGFTPTATYTVQFSFANAGLSPSSFSGYQGPGNIQVDIAGQTFITPTIVFDGVGAQTWYSASFQFTATAASETLLFTPNGTIVGEGFAGAVDGVQIALVPEPATLALGAIGFVAVIWAGKRQRTA
jgi:hypothetical protein